MMTVNSKIAADTLPGRDVCWSCLRPRAVCWCHAVRPIDSPHDFIFLQHPGERRNPIGTLRMAVLALQRSRAFIGIDFSSHAEIQALFEQRRSQSLVLYPSAESEELTTLPRGAIDGGDGGRGGDIDERRTIWVIDGTWSQAQKVWRHNPWLQTLPAFRLAPTRPGQYRIRKEPDEHCLSTIEAVAHLLELSGQPESAQALLRPFFAMVDNQVDFASGERRQGRVRLRRRPQSPWALPLPPDFQQLVLVHAEGNGWPVRMADRPPLELLQWCAHRPATGEHFSAFVQPSHGLSPTALAHQELSIERLSPLCSPAEFAARWQSFIRPDDVYYAFGHTPLSLVRKVGLDLAPYLDVKTLLAQRPRQRFSTLEKALAGLQLKASASVGIGRGGRRLASFVTLFDWLSRQSEVHS